MTTSDPIVTGDGESGILGHAGGECAVRHLRHFGFLADCGCVLIPIARSFELTEKQRIVCLLFIAMAWLMFLFISSGSAGKTEGNWKILGVEVGLLAAFIGLLVLVIVSDDHKEKRRIRAKIRAEYEQDFRDFESQATDNENVGDPLLTVMSWFDALPVAYHEEMLHDLLTAVQTGSARTFLQAFCNWAATAEYESERPPERATDAPMRTVTASA